MSEERSAQGVHRPEESSGDHTAAGPSPGNEGLAKVFDPVAYRGLAQARLAAVEDRIQAACDAAGRSRSEIHLIGVSKFHSAEEVAILMDLGLDQLGENRVQELLPKQDALAEAGRHPVWHLIGTLQTKKVRQVVGRVALIHSVDSTKLLDEIEKRAAQAGIVQPVLLQVNFSGAVQKHGFSEQEVLEVLRQAPSAHPHAQIRGLMTMAEPEWDEEELDRFFGSFSDFFESCKDVMMAGCDEFDILSMGMSHDFGSAIRNGATHLRIGTAIFGPRHYD